MSEYEGVGNFAGVAIGLALFGNGMGDMWIMVVGPVVGALIAAVCYRALFPAKK